MSIRQPVVAGRFYPGDRTELQHEINQYMRHAKSAACAKDGERLWGVMLPHAGYIYCGNIIGSTLYGANLPERLIILCPNHTGYGTPLSVWTEGAWLTPLGPVQVDSRLANQLVDSDSGFAADETAHLREHSIETLLPFLQTICQNLKIVPVCVGVSNLSFLKKAADGLSAVLSRPENRDVGMVVSSDMNHYENAQTTLQKDEHALDAILEMNPEKLLAVTQRENISMCGAAPMSLALLTAQKLGKIAARLCGHDTSGAASGDYSQVVGYAGVQLFQKTA